MGVKKDYKIFVLDGNMFSLNLYEQQLINLGYTDVSPFQVANNCFEALPDRPDIIFLDHSINYLNGVDILRKIKSFNPDIYVIFIAGLEDVEAVVSSLKYGAFDFIVRDDNDGRALENIIAKIFRVKQLLKKNTTDFYRNYIHSNSIL